jgi:large subunit ribosomal protein L18
MIRSQKRKKIAHDRRAQSVRSKIKRDKPRVAIFRSAEHIYAQIVDDAQGKTLVACSTVTLKNLSGDKKEQAAAVGKELAKQALDAGLSKVSFDRGGFLYHGRVRALADALRAGGLEI